MCWFNVCAQSADVLNRRMDDRLNLLYPGWVIGSSVDPLDQLDG
jgi:hypothetical protein